MMFLAFYFSAVVAFFKKPSTFLKMEKIVSFACLANIMFQTSCLFEYHTVFLHSDEQSVSPCFTYFFKKAAHTATVVF